MACTLPEEAWGSVSLAPQIDFALEFHERATAAKNPILRWLLMREGDLVRKWQKKNLSRFKKLFRVVETEFADYVNLSFVTSPHGFLQSRVSNHISHPKLNKKTFKIGFWGNMKFKPNVDALETLLKSLGGDKRFQLVIFGHASDEFKS